MQCIHRHPMGQMKEAVSEGDPGPDGICRWCRDKGQRRWSSPNGGKPHPGKQELQRCQHTTTRATHVQAPAALSRIQQLKRVVIWWKYDPWKILRSWRGRKHTARITLGATNDWLMQKPKEINLPSNLVFVKTQWIMLCDQYFYCYCTESCLHLGTLEGFWATEATKCALEQNWTAPQKAGRKRRGSRDFSELHVLLEWVWSDKD